MNKPPEINLLESELGFNLPEAYCSHVLDYGAESPIVGSDCAPRHVLDNTKALPDLLKENNIEHELPKKLVCFMMHQGYIAAWFDAEGGGDPQCCFFSEGTTPTPIHVGEFSAFMAKLIKDWS